MGETENGTAEEEKDLYDYEPLTWEQIVRCMWRWRVHAVKIDTIPNRNLIRIQFMEVWDQWQTWYYEP